MNWGGIRCDVIGSLLVLESENEALNMELDGRLQVKLHIDGRKNRQFV